MRDARVVDQSHLPLAARDNILQQQIPPPADLESILETISVPPEFEDDDFRRLPLHYRLGKLDTLQGVYIPTEEHAVAVQRLVALMRWGYRYRDPALPVVQQFIYDLADRGTGAGLSRQSGGGGAIGLVITGSTGTGKTSLLDRLTAYLGENVIIHKEINGRPVRQPQVLHVRVQCPPKSSLKSLGIEILGRIDEHLGTRHSRAAKTLSIPNLLDEVCSHCSNYFVGLVIVDDVQHLSPGNVESQEMLKFFTGFMERTGIPLVLSGTVRLNSLLASNPSSASKLAAKGRIELKRLEARSEEWAMLVEAMWLHSITETVQPMPDGLPSELHFYTQGITRILREMMVAIHTRMASLNQPCSKEMIQDIAATDLLEYQEVMQAMRLHLIGRLNEGDREDWRDFIGSDKAARVLKKALEERQAAQKCAATTEMDLPAESIPERMMREAAKATSASTDTPLSKLASKRNSKVGVKARATKRPNSKVAEGSGYEKAKKLGWLE